MPNQSFTNYFYFSPKEINKYLFITYKSLILIGLKESLMESKIILFLMDFCLGDFLAAFRVKSQFFCVFLKPKNTRRTMNRLSIIVMLAMALCLGSCGNTTSKQFKAMEEEITAVENQINELTNCDDLQMLNFSILGLRSDLDNMIQSAEIPDTEINQLDEMLTSVEASWNGKWAALECDQIITEDEMDTAGEEDDYQDYNIL